jgi:hypothetical protein
MKFPFLATIDQAVLTASLQEALDRLMKIKAEITGTPPVLVRNADWLEIYDVLDGIKENSEKVLRPAPRQLVDAYRRTRTWIREIHPRLVHEPEDGYGRQQLEIMISRLSQDLVQFGDS